VLLRGNAFRDAVKMLHTRRIVLVPDIFVLIRRGMVSNCAELVQLRPDVRERFRNHWFRYMSNGTSSTEWPDSRPVDTFGANAGEIWSSFKLSHFSAGVSQVALQPFHCPNAANRHQHQCCTKICAHANSGSMCWLDLWTKGRNQMDCEQNYLSELQRRILECGIVRA
jgi:hypothetical protein